MPKPKLDELTSDQDWQQADDNVAYDIMARHFPQVTQDQFTRIRESIRKKGQADDAILNQIGQSTQQSQGIAGTVMKGYQAMSQTMQQSAEDTANSFKPGGMAPEALKPTPGSLGADVANAGAWAGSQLVPRSPLEAAIPFAGPLAGKAFEAGAKTVPMAGRAIEALPQAVKTGAGMASRVAIPAGISGLDAMLQGRSPLPAALMTGAGAGLGEGAGAVGRQWFEKGGGGVGRMGNRAGQRVLDRLEELVPGSSQVPGNTVGEKLFNLGTHEGGRIARDNWRNAGEEADKAISANGGHLWSNGLSEAYQAVRATVSPNDPALQRKFVQLYGHGGSATVQQARNLVGAYRDINDKGTGAWGVGRKEVAQDLRDDVYRQIKQLAGPDIAEGVQLSDRQYNLSKVLFGEGSLLKNPVNPQGEPDLSRLSNELVNNAAKYKKKLGVGTYEDLIQDLMPGARPGQRATVLAGSDSPTNTLGRLISGRGGAAAIPGSATSVFFPGAANRYPGRDIRPGLAQNVGTGLGALLGNRLANNEHLRVK